MGLRGSKKNGKQLPKLALGNVIRAKIMGVPCKWRKRVDFGYFRPEMVRVANSLSYVGERKGKIKVQFRFLAEVNVQLEVLLT